MSYKETVKVEAVANYDADLSVGIKDDEVIITASNNSVALTVEEMDKVVADYSLYRATVRAKLFEKGGMFLKKPLYDDIYNSKQYDYDIRPY